MPPEPGEESPLFSTPAAFRADILLVEDDADLRLALVKYLTAEGCEVREAANGRDALEAFEQKIPDLLLVDIGLPGMDGFEVVDRIKGMERAEFLPIILLTARDGLADRERGLALGVDDYLTKPFDRIDLLLRVRSLLRTQRLYQNLDENNREMQAAYEAVRESEAKYHALIYDSQDAILVIDPEAKAIVEANRKAMELCGYNETEILGQPASLLCPPDQAEAWQALLSRIEEEGYLEEEIIELRTKSGEVIPIGLRASLTYHQGRPLLQALIADVRLRRLLDQERTKSERLSAIVETAVTVNQEINNPLFVITSAVEALQRSLVDVDSGVRSRLERIDEACRRIRQFTAQLSTVVEPASKEYLPGLRMLDLAQSVNPSPADEADDDL